MAKKQKEIIPLALTKVSETNDTYLFKLTTGGDSITFRFDKVNCIVYDNLNRGYTRADSCKDRELQYIFNEIERTMTMKLVKRKTLHSLLSDD